VLWNVTLTRPQDIAVRDDAVVAARVDRVADPVEATPGTTTTRQRMSWLKNRRHLVWIPTALLVCAAAGCKDSAGPPEERVATIEVASGNAQEGTVATALPQPIVIRALDAQGNAVRGASVAWVVAAANGTIAPVSEVTDAEGRASATWTLGTTASTLGGTATIGTASVSFTAIAKAGAAKTLTLSPGTLVLDAIGATGTFTANALDEYDNAITGRAPAWMSASTSIAMVDATGKVTAVTTGTTTVKATLDGVTGEGEVNVAPQPTLISVAPATAQLTTVGSTQQFTATAQDRNGNTLTLPATNYAWISTDPAIAEVNTSGLATAKASGTTLIRASIGNVSGQAQLTVAQTPASIAIAPQVDTLTTAKPTVQLAAAVKDADDQPIVSPAVTWTTSNNAIATVSSTGLVNAVSNGTVKIRAVSGTVMDSATIVVRLNAGPKTVADTYATQMNTPFVLVAPGLLLNDTLGIPAGTIISFGGGSLLGTVTQNAAGTTSTFGTGGSLRVNADGSVVFTPSTGFNGTFTFLYRVQNSTGAADGMVSIDVGTAPTAMNDAYATTAGVTLNVPLGSGLLVNDTRGFPLANVVSFGGPSLGGSVTAFAAGQLIAFGSGGFIGGFVLVNADGTMSFTPPTGYTGMFTFQYRISNGIGTSDATITITVS
jgi:large repetitive protein